ncbi:MAG: hypothetical protein E7541_05430 [Ruminococcaceae bacterium]|nr:hypothetical protein [Oscillospiraceae bacterium]
MEGVQIHNFDFNKLMEFVATTEGEVYLKTGEGDVLNLKSRLTQLLVLSGAISQATIEEATVVCENKDEESALFRMNLYRD